MLHPACLLQWPTTIRSGQYMCARYVLPDLAEHVNLASREYRRLASRWAATGWVGDIDI